jgi:hypothetical protein
VVATARKATLGMGSRRSLQRRGPGRDPCADNPRSVRLTGHRYPVWCECTSQSESLTIRLRVRQVSRPTIDGVPAVGDLVRSTAGQWMVRPPQHCPSGHKLAPGRVLVGHVPCGCRRRSGHMTWACECGATVHAPPLADACRVLAGPAAVRQVARRFTFRPAVRLPATVKCMQKIANT